MRDVTPARVRQAHRPRVLLVDDDPLVRRAIVRLLALRGFDVSEASNGTCALAALREASYDVVLSDLGMPGLGGLALLKAVREEHKLLPMVVLTGAPSSDTVIEALRHGAFSYLKKPCDTNSLVDELLRAARHHELVRERDASRSLASERQPDRELAARFQRALGGLFMVYQPIVDARTGRPHGYEALVRTGEKCVPNPGMLLDAAEQLEQLPQLSRRIRSKCARAFSSAADGSLLFVNLHARDLLDDDLLSNSAPLSAVASRVVLEITERAQLEDVPDVRARVDTLRRLGFRVAIDGVGAGYAGLTSFVAVEPEYVKLDMSLVRDVNVTPVKRRLVSSMAALARDLGVIMIAVGVETADEATALVELGCRMHQGYHHGKPARATPWKADSVAS